MENELTLSDLRSALALVEAQRKAMPFRTENLPALDMLARMEAELFSKITWKEMGF